MIRHQPRQSAVGQGVAIARLRHHTYWRRAWGRAALQGGAEAVHMSAPHVCARMGQVPHTHTHTRPFPRMNTTPLSQSTHLEVDGRLHVYERQWHELRETHSASSTSPAATTAATAAASRQPLRLLLQPPQLHQVSGPRRRPLLHASKHYRGGGPKPHRVCRGHHLPPFRRTELVRAQHAPYGIV